MTGVVAIGRAGLVAGIGLLYVLFAGGPLAGKTGDGGGLNCSIDEYIPCLKPNSSGRIRCALIGLGHRPGDPTFLFVHAKKPSFPKCSLMD